MSDNATALEEAISTGAQAAHGLEGSLEAAAGALRRANQVFGTAIAKLQQALNASEIQQGAPAVNGVIADLMTGKEALNKFMSANSFSAAGP